jgi:hypothetical protein
MLYDSKVDALAEYLQIFAYMSRYFFLLSFVFFIGSASGQDNRLEYSKDFEFNEGLYLDFKNFIQNKPIPKSKIVTDMDRDDIDFMHQLTAQKTIKYIDTAGKEQSIEPEKLWGYSKNNGVFIYYAKAFNRVSLIGTLCHFTASILQYVSSPGYGYGGMGGMGMGSRTMVTQELKQFMIDTPSGNVYDFTQDNMVLIMQSDPALLDEFNALKKKEKRESLFLYLRKYNQRHPLYFPGN